MSYFCLLHTLSINTNIMYETPAFPALKQYKFLILKDLNLAPPPYSINAP